MKINHVHAVYFSPTGNAKKVIITLAQAIADGEQTYAADPLTCDWDSLIEELGAPSVSSTTIYDVTHEAAFDYYGNEIDLDTAVQRIEENLGLYFSEQQ